MPFQPIPYEALGFVREISKDDWMARGQTSEWYYKRGYEALCLITSLCSNAGINPRRILDFGCGHGNVARMLVAAYKRAAVVGQDVDPEWLSWCSSVLGIEVVQSPPDIADVRLAESAYDLIWVGSVFTHIPEVNAAHLLREFGRALTRNGVLILTTAGKTVREGFQPGKEPFLERAAAERAARMYDESGYGFAAYTGGRHVSWGRSLISFDWVYRQSTRTELHLVAFQEAGWGRRQDVYAFTPTQGSSTRHPDRST